MKYALLIVEVPADDSSQAASTLRNFLVTVQGKLKPSGPSQMLNAGAYLCDLSHGLTELTGLAAAAKDRAYKTRTLFFDQIPSWVITNP